MDAVNLQITAQLQDQQTKQWTFRLYYTAIPG